MRTVETFVQDELFRHPTATQTENHRLFFALMPNAATRHEINHAAALVQQQHPQLRARWVKPERFHATLSFLGDYPALPKDIAEQAKSIAGRLHSSQFCWTLDYATSFRGREPPCVLRSTVVPERLQTLWRDLNTALEDAGLFRRVEHSFTPHVTLAYGRHELSDDTTVTPIVWHVDRIVLIHNVVGTGSYQVLGDWPLFG